MALHSFAMHVVGRRGCLFRRLKAHDPCVNRPRRLFGSANKDQQCVATVNLMVSAGKIERAIPVSSYLSKSQRGEVKSTRPSAKSPIIDLSLHTTMAGNRR